MKVPVIHLLVAAVCSLPAVGQQPTAGPQPAIPDNIDLPKDARLVFQAKGDGVQIYTCSETAGVIDWSPPKPDARLLDTSGHPIGTHFAGPTWKLNDGGQVEGELTGRKRSPDASIPWFRFRAKDGTATGSLASVAFIRRTETNGGVAPSSGCKSRKDVQKTVQIHYTATYSFYAER